MTQTGTAPTGSAQNEPAAPPDVDAFFGLMRISGALMALPVAAIREAVRGQATYAVLPVKAEGLIGAIDIRGTVIPVLDLRGPLGLPAEDGDQFIVVVRSQGYLIGLRVCEVCGLARPRATELSVLAAKGPTSPPMLATHAFKSGDEIATLLDADRITALPGTPLVLEKSLSSRAQDASTTEVVLMFSFGRSSFGIDAACIDAAVPAVRITPHAVGTGLCWGVIDHQGYNVPVVDTTAALGLGPETPARETRVVVVRFAADAMLGFAVDAVDDIVRVARADILPIPALSRGAAALFRGMVPGKNGRQNLLLDADGLRANRELLALARLRRPRIALQIGDVAKGSAQTAALSGRTQPFLTYVAGGDHATSLDQITEILTYPTDLAPFELFGKGMLGLFTHRGRVAPLVCLGTFLGGRCDLDTSTARVLFAEDAGRAVGFVVQALLSIETASRQSSGPNAQSNGPPAIMGMPMVMLGEQRRMVSNVDLAAELRKLYRDAEAVVSADTPATMPMAVSA